MTRIRLLLYLGLLRALPGAALAGPNAACVVLEGDRILAGDLVPAWPALREIPADTVLGYTPAPGVRRLLRRAELERLAKRYQVPAPANALCLERAMQVLDRGRLLAAMQAALGLPEAHIEIQEFSRFAVPRGDLEFPHSGLPEPPLSAPGTAVLWRGRVRYGGNRRFAVWARVKISAPLRRVLAAENLPAGKPVEAPQLRSEVRLGFPRGRGWAESPADVAGRLPRRSILAGTPILLSQLAEPREVNRGDAVEIHVEAGAAHLVLSGRAESAGRRGETVSVRNLTSGKNFAARVEDKGRVTLAVPPAGRSLPRAKPEAKP